MCKINQFGRSMVEMIGVLAIVGILSVGSIAGYQKAMLKYKLNKQSQQLSHLLNVMHRYKAEWDFGTKTFVNLVPYYKALGEIPNEMIKDSTVNLYDVFDSAVKMNTNYCSDICKTVEFRVFQSQYNVFDTCQNIITIAKSFSADLLNIGMYKYTEDNSNAQYKYEYSGSKYCENSKCIKDINQEDIYNMCQYCVDSTSCVFYFNMYMND